MDSRSMAGSPPAPDAAEEMGAVHKRSPLAERVTLFLSLFRAGRMYARRWQSRDGRAGYSPACANEWRRACGKPRMKCSDCRHAAYLPFDEVAVAEHLAGNQVLGVYPLLPDDTCRFLAIDFDGSGWKKDVQAVAAACTSRGIPFAVEISRSGNGAHLWLFFEGPVPAALARNLGSLLLTQSMQANARLGFSSYDRMFPNQDTLPQGGFGNLIALPFQKSAYPNGGCLFVDEHFQAYPDQWAFYAPYSASAWLKRRLGSPGRACRCWVRWGRMAATQSPGGLAAKLMPCCGCPMPFTASWRTGCTSLWTACRKARRTTSSAWQRFATLPFTRRRRCGCRCGTSRASYAAQRMWTATCAFPEVAGTLSAILRARAVWR